MYKYLTLTLVVLLAACGEKDELAEKKAELQKLEKEATELNGKITELRAEVAELDPASVRDNAVLVTAEPVARATFEHYLEVRGTVASDRNVTLSAEAAGVIRSIPVEEGQRVRRGQTLARIDADVLQNNVRELETQIELARTVFERRERLWKQKIGTEVQYLEAKSQVDALESRLGSLRAQVGKTALTAPFDGAVEEVMARVGENAMPGMPLMRLVSTRSVYVEADLAERYLGQVKAGDQVQVQVPSLGDSSLVGRVRAVGQVINPNNRTFQVEIDVPGANGRLQPNMLTRIRIKDFAAEDAVVVPTRLIQEVRGENVVFVVDGKGNEAYAKRRPVERGLTYQDRTHIKSGLRGGERLIVEGHRDVTDSTRVKVVESQLAVGF
ncbi:MAG: efflux RND transporter periplasmic adaptor subunit [Catalinimonas sp.]